MKPRAIKGFRGLLKAKALWGLIFTLVFTSVALAAGYRCTPCPQNYYCKAGIGYECPPETPVTISTGAKSVDECFSCADRDGESYPFYDEISGNCMACWQVPETTTPYWNGTACTTCPDGKTWDSDELACVEAGPACAFEIPHGDTTLCLVESVDDSVYGASAPRSDIEETSEFLSTYGIANVSSYFTDYWAGAMKYCQDKGLRLPTMDELCSIMNILYGTNETCTSGCDNANASYVGEQYGCYECTSELPIANQSLFNFLGANSITVNITDDTVVMWSNAECDENYAYYRSFSDQFSEANIDTRNDNYPRAMCVK